jgi:hypothetical protein
LYRMLCHVWVAVNSSLILLISIDRSIICISFLGKLVWDDAGTYSLLGTHAASSQILKNVCCFFAKKRPIECLLIFPLQIVALLSKINI